jgi:Flp pilus assembly protein TadG
LKNNINTTKRRTRQREKGHAIIETALLAPWIIFLFAGTLDMGFYLQALISIQNAARVAAEYTSSSSSYSTDSSGACRYALGEMQMLPNLRTLSTCNSLPLQVVATAPTGPDGLPATAISVTYQTGQMILLPYLTGRLTITRTVTMRQRDI